MLTKPATSWRDHHHAGAERLAFALRYGHARTPLALVLPDLDWPGTWRIAWLDGRLSDIVNLARAKDAAEAFSERGPPARSRLFHWHTSNSPRGAAPVRQMRRPLPQSLPPAGVGVAAAGGVAP
jgi:hypothetical protein